ncbi:MAG TPA: thiamine phosphate synthase [Candidatus Eremiobacteraceae bacterium]|nr:thiamine phosphate synthase [Candidatus Eremiobacteraceae bacterium]
MPSRHRARLERVRIYLVTDASPRVAPVERFLREAIAGGVGMVQLREKQLPDAQLLEIAQRFSSVCRALDVPFIVNDRVDIALASGADGVHVGQDDLSVKSVRMIAGEDLIVGLSTHAPEQIEAAASLPVDYIGVGPIHQTPTKQGRPPVGVQLARYAAARSPHPFFAIGGLDPGNVVDVVQAGARAVSVLRWIAQADDPKTAARELFHQIEEARRARSL